MDELLNQVCTLILRYLHLTKEGERGKEKKRHPIITEVVEEKLQIITHSLIQENIFSVERIPVVGGVGSYSVNFFVRVIFRIQFRQ